jgi:uncharacterized protein
MFIDLQSIDEEGKDYNFDELSDELQGAFKDLIGEEPFKIQVQIRPLGNTYQLMGFVKSRYPEVCSKCGYDIDLPLENKINEIIVIEKHRPRNTQVSQSQQNFESHAPSVTYINESTFDLKEFLHEMMASGFADYPQCLETVVCESRQHREYNVEPQEKSGHPGFAALKKIKIQ